MGKKKHKNTSRKKLYIIVASIVISILLLLAAISAFVSWYTLNRLNMDSLGANQIRQTLVRSIDELSEPAPRDARTGDYYFPEAKLMLPDHKEVSRVTYSYDHSDNTLRVTTQQMLAAASSKLYGTHDFEKLFELLPEYQACHRGMLFSKIPIDSSDYENLEEAWQKQLPDGSIIHAYTESGCPAQSKQADGVMYSITSY